MTLWLWHCATWPRKLLDKVGLKSLVNYKKLWFILASVFLVGFSYYIAYNYVKVGDQSANGLAIRYLVLVTLVSIVISLFVQYLEGGSRGAGEILFVGLTPSFLCSGVMFFYLYYPNLSPTIKILAGLFYIFLLYTLLLLNNVLLVVKSREEVIPVYRVATGWLQIVLLSMTISIFTGLHRLHIQPILQTLASVLISFFFYNYSLWVYSFDKETRKIKAVESLVISLSLALFAGWSSFITLFFSGETFLKGLFIASVFLLGLGYIQLYIRNALNKRALWDYIIPTVIFFLVLSLFKP